MGGRNCCVTSCRRRSHDYRGRKILNGLTFHCFPAWRRYEGEQISRLTKVRRAAWVAAVGRSDITFNHIPTSMRVCSRHFHSGKPAYEMLESDRDWVPSLNLSHSKGKVRCTKRLFQSVQEDEDQDQSCTAETRSSREKPGGPKKPADRPWREVKPLLQSALQSKTHKRLVKKTNHDFRDFFRNALEASLDASGGSRRSCGETSCLNCVRLQKRITELEDKLSRLTGQQEDTEASRAPLRPDQDLQSPDTAHAAEEDPAFRRSPEESPPADPDEMFAPLEDEFEDAPDDFEDAHEFSEESFVRPHKPKTEPRQRRKKPEMGKPCRLSCRRECRDKISEERRKSLYATYWNMSPQERKAFIFSSVSQHETTSSDGSNKRKLLFYHFTTEQGLIQMVCKIFFLSTLGYGPKCDWFIRKLI